MSKKDNTNQKPRGKKPYKSPRLKVLGSVVELSRGFGNSSPDGFGKKTKGP